MNNGPKASATPGGAEREAPEAMEPRIGPGLGTLLSGVKASESDGQRRLGPAFRPAGHSNLTLLKWSLLAADAVLVGLAVFLMLSGSSPLTPARIGTCVVVLGLGAWLGCLAFWWQPQTDELVEGNSTAQPAGKEPESPPE